MSFLKKAPCNEAICIIKTVEDRLAGKDAKPLQVEYPIHKTILKLFDKLLENEKQMSLSSQRLLNTIPALSEFDVKMSHEAYQMMDFAKEMSVVSESNLSIVEENNSQNVFGK